LKISNNAIESGKIEKKNPPLEIKGFFSICSAKLADYFESEMLLSE
jgi:hypothetical protein